MLEITGLDVSYGSVAAVRNVSIEVGRGEIVGLIGPNGAGKSTTLHAVMGLVGVRRGDVRLAGASVRGRSPEDVARAGISLVPEGRRIFAELTVAENLRLGLSGRRSQAGAAEDIEAVHAQFPIVKEFASRRAGALSGGQQQQLAIARALVARPDVLLLDEPSLGLAPSMIAELFDILADLRDEGTTILLVDQMAASALALADRGYVLDSGHIVREDLAAALADDPEVEAAYLGHAQAAQQAS